MTKKISELNAAAAALAAMQFEADNAGTSERVTGTQLIDLIQNTFARVVKKVSETVNSDIVLHDDNELFVAVRPNLKYGFMLMLLLDSPVAAGFKYTFTVPSGGIGKILSGSPSSTVPTSVVTMSNTIAVTTNAGEQMLVIFGGFLTISAGNFRFRWAQNGSDPGNTVVRQSSYLIVWEELP